LINDGAQIHSCSCGEFSFKKIDLVEHDGLPSRYDSISLFLNDLQNYEYAEGNSEFEEYEEVINLTVENIVLTQEKWELGKSKDESKNQLKKLEAKILFAYVSVFCGCLLSIIPHPVTRSAGASLISGGLYVLSEDEFVNRDQINKEKK